MILAFHFPRRVRIRSPPASFLECSQCLCVTCPEDFTLEVEE